MTRKCCAVLLMVFVLGTLSAFAGDSASGSGHFINHNNMVEITEMDDGSSSLVMHYSSVTLADNSNHPSADMAAECVGVMRTNADGSFGSGEGTCFGKTADGDTQSYWWKVDAAGTSACPDMCGSWGYFAGTGKFKGLQGTGTWQRTNLIGDLSWGTWKNSYSMP
jgi:uncharacterized membrane protein